MASATVSEKRRYHDTRSAYVLPNDAVEQDRLDAQASAIVQMIGGFPFLGPLQALRNEGRAVDVGCGTGVATIQLADMFSNARVYGLDLSEPSDAIKTLAPSNVTWVRGSILDVKNSNDNNSNTAMQEVLRHSAMHYVFGRMLFLGINDWPLYFTTIVEALKPGCVIEHQDLDWDFFRAGTSRCLSKNWEWHQRVLAAVEKAGLSTRAGSTAAENMRAAGLEILRVQTFEFTFTPGSSAAPPASEAMSQYVQSKLLPQYPELLRKMLGMEGLGLADTEVQRLTKEALHDLTAELGIYQKYTVTVARKPVV